MHRNQYYINKPRRAFALILYDLCGKRPPSVHLLPPDSALISVAKTIRTEGRDEGKEEGPEEGRKKEKKKGGRLAAGGGICCSAAFELDLHLIKAERAECCPSPHCSPVPPLYTLAPRSIIRRPQARPPQPGDLLARPTLHTAEGNQPPSLYIYHRIPMASACAYIHTWGVYIHGLINIYVCVVHVSPGSLFLIRSLLLHLGMKE